MRITNWERMQRMDPLPRREVFTFSRGPKGEARLSFPQTIVFHSPTGMEWGYGGSGPADTALNVLIHFVNGAQAWALHQTFKQEVIAKIPRMTDSFTLTADEVERWIMERGGGA